MLAERLGAHPQCTPEVKAEVVGAFEWYWANELALGKDDNYKMSLEEYIDNVAAARASPSNIEQLRTKIVPMLANLFFKVIDVNANGVISIEEFKYFHEACGIYDKRDTQMAFDALDSNHNGTISREEYVNGQLEFWLGDDVNAPANLMWGPLDPPNAGFCAALQRCFRR
mmetsp:Transcript_17340/g.44858  ORF Transcript_17340/g.44858 Transcript_17340/m.44858 type:complete len:170 (+) Transcript_17340:3-512(+)